jgi:hypothetical protein
LKVFALIKNWYSDSDTFPSEFVKFGHRRAQARGRLTVPRRS